MPSSEEEIYQNFVKITCLIFKTDESFTLDFYPTTQYPISIDSIF